MDKLASIDNEAKLCMFDLFNGCTSLFLQGNSKAIQKFRDTYREVNGIKVGSPLCRETPFKLYGPHPPTEAACHMVGTGLSGISKLTRTYGMEKWKFECHNHDKIGDCLKVTVDIEKNLFLVIKHPLGDCTYDKCNGNPKCTYNHPNGFFAPVEKKEEKEKKEKKEGK